VADGFYEFTDPEDLEKKRKDKWLFTKKEEPIFCIAGIWRETPEVGEAFTMLTMQPGPDIAPYHDRQIVILDRSVLSILNLHFPPRSGLRGRIGSTLRCRPSR
jgi:putative SOS response-associated peptidase YedK